MDKLSRFAGYFNRPLDCARGDNGDGVTNNVTPAKAGVQKGSGRVDSRLRWNDKKSPSDFIRPICHGTA